MIISTDAKKTLIKLASILAKNNGGTSLVQLKESVCMCVKST